MNDCGTMCRACNRASGGYEYCRKCESDIAARERADDERGFCLPVKVASLTKSVWVEDADGQIIVAAVPYAMSQESKFELAEVLRDAINAHYSDETEGA